MNAGHFISVYNESDDSAREIALTNTKGLHGLAQMDSYRV